MERKKINHLKVVLAEKGMTNKQLAKILNKALPLYQSGLRMLPSPMLNVHPVGKDIGCES